MIASRGASGETYHVGSGVTVTSRELAQAVAQAMHLASPEIVASGETFPGDIARWAMDISKTRQLGFEPQVDLKTGLARSSKAISMSRPSSWPAFEVSGLVHRFRPRLKST